MLTKMIFALAALVAPAALAQSELSWHTIDGGGSVATAGGIYELGGTVGQPDAGRLSGGSYELVGGFWNATISIPCPGDVNGNRDVDLADLSTVLAHFGAPSGQALATGDLDGDGDVDLTDLSILLANFGSSCPR